jgi:hypothetical protein
MSKTRRAQADLARLRGHLLDLGRLAEGASALCAVLRRPVGDALDRLAGVDPELPGLVAIGEV